MKSNALSVVLAALIGTIAGVGSYTFIYARGYSYFASDPGACTNCHVMRTYYDGWAKSSHHGAATCNDCHTPSNPVGKLATKTSNGFFHSAAFTLRLYPDAIQIKSGSARVTELACRRCHEGLVQAVNGPYTHGSGMSCIHCHASVGHSEAMPSVPTALAERF